MNKEPLNPKIRGELDQLWGVGSRVNIVRILINVEWGGEPTVFVPKDPYTNVVDHLGGGGESRPIWLSNLQLLWKNKIPWGDFLVSVRSEEKKGQGKGAKWDPWALSCL